MKKEEVSAVIDRIDEQYIREASAFAADDQASSGAPAGPEKIRRRRLRVRVLAACAALVVLAGSATAAFAAEEKEYKTAVAFFAENELSTEGLSRADVKAVYRDIVTQRFALDKTEEVLRQTVTGVEIEQEESTLEELVERWGKYVEELRKNPPPQKGIKYNVTFLSRNNEEGNSVLDKSALACYQDGNLLWETELNACVLGELYTTDGTAVWGRDIVENYSSEQPEYGWFARIDEEGNCVWERHLDHGFLHEYIQAILDNGDGTWAVISVGDANHLCLSQFSVEGDEISFCVTKAGKLLVQNAARLGEDYIIQIYETGLGGSMARLIKLDHDGNKIGDFNYKGEDCDYRIIDMVQFGGGVYLSAVAFPKQPDGTSRSEIANVLQYAHEAYQNGELLDDENFPKGYVFTSEKLTQVMRDNYTTVLLLCDPTDGTPKTFFEVEESLSGKLAINDDGQLEWEVYKIVEASCSIDSNSYSFIVRAKVYQYVFDTDGNLIGRIDTGKLSVLHV
ncbi:MAG: hypothetical protein KIG36_05000 [Eubacteriales bacterium]|nr:hypothetical protein [Eubacteriales bacterium]